MINIEDFSQTIENSGRGGAARRFVPGEVRGRVYFTKEKGKVRQGYVTLYVSIDKNIADFNKHYKPRFSPNIDDTIVIAPSDKGWKFTTSSKETLSAKVRFDFPITYLPTQILVWLKTAKDNIVMLQGRADGEYYVLTLAQDQMTL